MDCQNCGRELPGRRRKWCSDSCRKEASRKRTKRTKRTENEVFGSREPAYRSAPPYSVSKGSEAVKLAESLGLTLDPWQRDFLEAAMGQDDAGAWVADEAALVVPRQNGKTVALLVRALWGALEGGERLILWTAHEFKTSREAFELLKQLVELPEFEETYGKPTVSVSHGKEGVTFQNGARILFIARTRTSGRGFSPDFVIIDESFELNALALAALKPALAAGKSPSMWYASSAPHPTSTVLRQICLRGRAGEADRLTYFEWCAAETVDPSAVSAWLAANPGIGYRITLNHVASELAAFEAEPEHFLRERLGIWYEAAFPSVFDARLWASLADLSPPSPSGVKVIAVDVDPDRKRAVIAAAGDLGDGRVLVEILDDRKQVAWVVDRVVDLVAEHDPHAILVDSAGQSGTLIAPMQRAGVDVRRTTGPEMVAAAGQFYDAVLEGRLVHMDQPELNAAVEGARQRQLGDVGWAWGRRSSAVNVSPLVAASLAVFGVNSTDSKSWEPLFAWVGEDGVVSGSW